MSAPDNATRTGPCAGRPEHADSLHVIDATGAVVSTVNTCVLLGPAFPALSQARYSSVSADDTVNGPV